jgi:hypothetical protein
VNDGDEEQTQLKALQTTLTVLQSQHCPDTEAAVSALLATCFRMLSGAQASNAVHATAAATARQAVSVLLARAREGGAAPAPAAASTRALALVRVLCSLARGAAPDLAAPLPRAFAVDLLDDALRAHASLFTASPPFSELLAQCVFPLLTDLLAGGTGAAEAAVPLSPAASLPDEVGVDPAEVAERRCALRTATTLVCTYAHSLPRHADALLERLLAAAQSGARGAWHRAAALEAVQRCAADARLARCLVDAAEPRTHALTRMAGVAAGTLTESCGVDAVRHATPCRALVSSSHPSLAGAERRGRCVARRVRVLRRAGERGGGAHVRRRVLRAAHQADCACHVQLAPDVDDDAAQRAHCVCIALECVLAQCHAVAQLAEEDASTAAQTAHAAVRATWQPLLDALALALARGLGEALVVEVLKALTAFTCAASAAADVGARNAFLATLCQFAQDAAAGAEPGDAATPRQRVAPASAVVAELTPRALHCVRALLNCVLALAPGLGTAGWRILLSALLRVDAALETDRAGAERTDAPPVGERATLSTALEQLYAHVAVTLSDDALEQLLVALREVSALEVRDAETGSAVSTAGGQRLYMLTRHAKLLIAAPHRLPRLWAGLEAHAALVAQSDAAAVRCEAASVVSLALQGTLAAPDQHRASAAAAEAARLAGEQTFTCVLLAALHRIAVVQPDKGDVCDALLRTLLDIMERHSDSLGPAWLPALQFVAASAADAHPDDASPPDAGDDAATHGPLASGFACATALVQHLLPSVPAALRTDVVAALAAFGHQQADVNTALSAVGLLWDVADYTAREEDDDAPQAGRALQVLPAVFAALASLSADARPEIRNSAVRALVAAQAAHAPRLPPAAAQAALWEQLLPAAWALRNASCAAAATDAAAAAAAPPAKRGGVVLLVHHSRNTAAKQWDETLVLCLSGLARVLRSQLADCCAVPGFEARWASVLELLSDAAASASREVGSAALACLGAVGALGVLRGAPWTRLLAVFEHAAERAACDAVRAELPGALLRLYAAQRDAFHAADVALLLRVADAVARAPPGAHARQLAGELPAHQCATLELFRALVPLPPHGAAADLQRSVFSTLAAQVRDAAAAPAAAGGLTAAYGAHAVSALVQMHAAAPASVRADVLAAIMAALQAAGRTRRQAPAGALWRSALSALAPLLRDGPPALNVCRSQQDPAIADSAWRALLVAADSMLRLDGDSSARGLLADDDAPMEPAREDAAQLAADEEAHAAALDALADGALGGMGAVGAPTDVLAGLVSLLDAGATAAPSGSATQAASTLRLANVCTRKLYVLASAPVAASTRAYDGRVSTDLDGARLAVACLALPTLLLHCQALLAQCTAAEADAAGGGVPRPACDAALCALEAVGELQPDARAVDAAVQHAERAGRFEAPAMRALLPVLRAVRPGARHNRAHLLLLYGPLVQALALRDARLRGAVTELLHKTGRALALLPEPEA